MPECITRDLAAINYRGVVGILGVNKQSGFPAKVVVRKLVPMLSTKLNTRRYIVAEEKVQSQSDYIVKINVKGQGFRLLHCHISNQCLLMNPP